MSPDANRVASTARGRRDVLAAAVLWSLSGVVTKGLVDLPPAEIAFYRSLFAGLALLPLVRRDRVAFRPVMLPGALAFGAMIGLYIAAIKLTTAANAIFLQCTAAFWLIPASWALGERPDRRSVEGIGLATVGIAAIVIWGSGGRAGEARGIALGLASGVAYAAVVLLFRRLRGLDPIWLSAANNLGGALALAAWMAAVGRPPGLPPAPQLATLAAFGVGQMAIPYALFARGLREVPAPDAALIGLLEPVLNPVWVWLVHGERPADGSLVGGAFLLAGLAVRFRPLSARGRA